MNEASRQDDPPHATTWLAVPRPLCVNIEHRASTELGCNPFGEADGGDFYGGTRT